MNPVQTQQEETEFPALLVEAIAAHHPDVLPERPTSVGDIVAVANFACDGAGLACGPAGASRGLCCG